MRCLGDLAVIHSVFYGVGEIGGTIDLHLDIHGQPMSDGALLYGHTNKCVKLESIQPNCEHCAQLYPSGGTDAAVAVPIPTNHGTEYAKLSG